MPVGEKLIRLIESGSMYGIYFVISSLEYQAVRDSMCTYGENTLKHFPERIVFALSPADSEFLLDDLNVSGLQDNTVYFTDGVQGENKAETLSGAGSAGTSGVSGNLGLTLWKCHLIIKNKRGGEHGQTFSG